jgi:DNA-binding HxlR family transcriptional regulator
MRMARIKEISTNFANKKALSEVYMANIISRQWTVVICSCLLNGKQMFSELQNFLPKMPLIGRFPLVCEGWRVQCH